MTVMLVDDHAVVRAGYRLLLSQTMEIDSIWEASTGEEACEKYLTHRPEVIVMDLNLPGIGGLEAARRIVKRDAGARILFFSIHDEPVYIRRAMEAGAMGYITKSCAPETLVRAVASLRNGIPYMEANMSPKPARQESTRSIAPVDLLTRREFDIFCLLTRGLTPREIAQELRLSVKTVSNYVTTIKEKLGVKTLTELVRLFYENNLMTDLD